MGLPWRQWRQFDDRLSRFDTIPACDGQTDSVCSNTVNIGLHTLRGGEHKIGLTGETSFRQQHSTATDDDDDNNLLCEREDVCLK